MDYKLVIWWLGQKTLSVASALLAIAIYFILFLWVSVITFGSIVFSTGNRAWNLAVAQDQLGNTSVGGHEDETFSSRCFREQDKKKYEVMRIILDWVFLKATGEVDHCYNAFLHEEMLKYSDCKCEDTKLY